MVQLKIGFNDVVAVGGVNFKCMVKKSENRNGIFNSISITPSNSNSRPCNSDSKQLWNWN